MGRRSRSEIYMARFARLKEIRERELGWDVVDLVSRLGKKPSAASIYRLEAGEALRVPNVRRIFDLVNRELGGRLSFEQEVELVKVDDQKRP